MAVFEELFFYRNTTTALAVGAGRGVAILAAQRAGIPLYEYTPMQIKLAVTGNGHADKRAVQSMVKMLLSLKCIPKPDDAADALAAAICHGCTIGPAAEEYRIR
jgi:crossover junction endodeoxyribonuclease RuvC